MASEQPLIPGLDDEMALLCLAFVPRAYHKTLRSVCRSWKMLLDFPVGSTALEKTHSLTCRPSLAQATTEDQESDEDFHADATESTLRHAGPSSSSTTSGHLAERSHDTNCSCRSLMFSTSVGRTRSFPRGADEESLIQTGGLYQMRRLAGLSETWIYVRTRTSTFVNNWRFFDVTNRVWAPQMAEIPYIAAAVAARTKGVAGYPLDAPVAEMNKVRGVGSAAVGSRIYVFGGWREGGPSLTDMFCYDSITERWIRKAHMLTPRCYMAAAVIGNKIYVAGGMTRPRLHQSELLMSAEVYDTETDEWSRLPEMPFSMFFSCAVEICDKLYVSGSRPPLDTGSPGRGCMFDPETCCWCPFFGKKLGDVMQAPCASVGPWFFAVSSNSIQAWDSRTDIWHTLPVTKQLTAEEEKEGKAQGLASPRNMQPGPMFMPDDVAAVASFDVMASLAQMARERVTSTGDTGENTPESSQKLQLLNSALKDCVFMGLLDSTDEACQMALLHRSGAVTRIRIEFSSNEWLQNLTSPRDAKQPPLLSPLPCSTSTWQASPVVPQGPIISEVVRLSVAPPLEDEQPVDMALITL